MALTPGGEDQPRFQALAFGFRLDRDAAALPQGVSAPLFVIHGGSIIVMNLLGRVTTVIQALANATKVIAVPTVGTPVDLCATADITGREVGGKLSLPGDMTAPLVVANAGAIALQNRNLVVDAGEIHLSCAASATGEVKWSLFFQQFDETAWVEVV